MNDVRIYTQINSPYQVLDASGQLPFSVIFGLCRQSPADTDPRPLVLEIAGSVLDVPTERWRDAFTVYQCHIDANGVLASILEPGKKYRIRLASEDLGVKRWAYGDRKQFIDNDWKPSHDSEAVKLVNSRPNAGNATFTVVKRLSWPPTIETRMLLCASSSSSDSALANTKLSSSTALEVSVINTSSDCVTVQTRGHQRFLIPRGPFQPEPDADDDRMRIIDATPRKPPTSSLQVVDSTTGEVVRGNKKRGTGPLIDVNADRRPKTEDLVTLKPGASVVRKIDIGSLVDGLEDGQYKIRMQSRGCRWWHGEAGKEQGGDGRVPAHLCEIIVPPLMLESQDEVELRIRDGKIDQSM
ncbi:hypothetical protein MMC29_000953 [Sticta canariensis]|nr:hypothetical protein [Sticta canariensis]